MNTQTKILQEQHDEANKHRAQLIFDLHCEALNRFIAGQISGMQLPVHFKDQTHLTIKIPGSNPKRSLLNNIELLDEVIQTFSVDFSSNNGEEMILKNSNWEQIVYCLSALLEADKLHDKLSSTPKFDKYEFGLKLEESRENITLAFERIKELRERAAN